jgi:vacuolar protein sorting-associated protein 41
MSKEIKINKINGQNLEETEEEDEDDEDDLTDEDDDDVDDVEDNDDDDNLEEKKANKENKKEETGSESDSENVEYTDEEEKKEKNLKEINSPQKNLKEESEESEESESEEEKEPLFKYSRFQTLNSFFEDKKDKEGIKASALSVGEKFLALGTYTGDLFILDLEGNIIKDKIFKGVHEFEINELSIDFSGEYIASASTDGKVKIHGLYTKEVIEYNFSRPVKTVAIDPDYSKNTSRPIVVGGKDGKLTMFKKGYFNSNKQTIIHQGNSNNNKRRGGNTHYTLEKKFYNLGKR